MSTIDELREQAMATGLSLREAAASPVEQFQAWLDQARAAGLYQPRGMTLATVNALGRPTARMVVLAAFDEQGFDFATDARSPKIEDLRHQPWAALVFHWAEMERQVRIEGEVELLDDAAGDAYFYKRARESQLASWVARQSEVIDNRGLLEDQLLTLLAKHEHQPVSRPPHYLAYRVKPSLVEFWQARSDHLHDRVRYRPGEGQSWITERLAP